jgi:hypothetical protein
MAKAGYRSAQAGIAKASQRKRIKFPDYKDALWHPPTGTFTLLISCPCGRTSDAVTAASAYGSGWHLPTKTELKVLYEHRNVVGGFAKDDYWSCTELDSNSAWIQGFVNGDQDRYNKYSKLSVRAVRAF